MAKSITVINGELIDEDIELTLRELSQACSVHAEYILELVEAGLLEPVAGTEPTYWRFDVIALRRSRTAMRMQRVFNIDINSLPLVLDLLEEVQSLRQRIEVLESLLEE